MKLIITFFLFLFLFSFSYGQMLPISDEELIQSSEGIIEGKVLSSKAKWVNNNQYIYTFSQIIVNKSYAGNFHPGDTITVVSPGGYDPVKDIGMKVSDQAVFKKNEETIVFLKRAEGILDAIDYRFLEKDPTIPANIMRINGYFQGKQTIISNPQTGKKMIRKSNDNKTIELQSYSTLLQQKTQALKK